MSNSVKLSQGDEFINEDIATEIANKVVRKELNKTSQAIREDFVLIFGVFAALLIFLGIDIQVFDKAPRFSMLVGFSCFLLGSILAFLLGIQNILKQSNTLKDYKNNPLVYFIGACFIGAILCFAWAHFIK